MCGIAGIYHPRGLSGDRTVIGRMSAALVHRGPDADGVHVDRYAHLAARRLAIIAPEAGPQPVYSPDGARCIVYNGEIYNYRQLRRDLAGRGYPFRTETDTEVVLAAYCTWGAQCLDRLKGMFAFCIRDTKKNTLFLARDRFGIKPLYITSLADETLLFASEVKALLQHPGVRARLYPRAIDNLLTCGFNLAPHTFFENVKQVLPGHCLSITGDRVQQREYWDIDLAAPPLTAPEEEISRELRARMEATVQESLVADVPVASYLSGGIDSSAVTGIYARLSDTPVKTISITFDEAGYDESAFARQVAEHFRTDHVAFRCAIDPESIRHLIRHLENPLVSLLNLPLYLLSRRTRDLGLRVVLTGDGADETLAGYDYFKLLKAMDFIDRSKSRFRKNILRRIDPGLHTPDDAQARYVLAANARDRFPLRHPAVPFQFQSFAMKDNLYSPAFTALLQETPADDPFYFDPQRCAHRPLLDQALYFETKTRLLNLTLPLSDKMSMANSVEARPLFLDHELVDFFFRIPHHYKMQGLDEKHILKKSMAGLLPPEICGRRKQPLQPPGAWFIRAAGDLLRDLLGREKITRAGYFNPTFVEALLAEHDSGNTRVDYSGVLVVIFFVQLWHDIFLGF